MRRPLARIVFAVLVVASLAGTLGCFNPFHPLIGSVNGVSEPPPVPDSPQNALRLLEWAYTHRAIDEYRELFTADYRFVFSDLDSNGAAYRDVPWTRDDEIISTTKLFLGGDADQPAATDIRLTLDRNFSLSADTRPGKNPTWHKSITTQVLLHIQLSDGHADDVTGSVKFFLTRGDSALIPEDLPFGPDPLRWYIDRWEDLTAQGGATGGLRAGTGADFVRAMAARSTALRPSSATTAAPRSSAPSAVAPSPVPATTETWGTLKHRYRI